jgi:hypothetical protein
MNLLSPCGGIVNISSFDKLFLRSMVNRMNLANRWVFALFVYFGLLRRAEASLEVPSGH